MSLNQATGGLAAANAQARKRAQMGLAKARVLHRSATMAFVEASVFDAEGGLCCHASGTFKCIRRLPVGAKASQALNGAAPVQTD